MHIASLRGAEQVLIMRLERAKDETERMNAQLKDVRRSIHEYENDQRKNIAWE